MMQIENPRIATTSNRFLNQILRYGGLATSEAADIHGEGRKLKRYGGGRVFRQRGHTIDDIATRLHHDGWLTPDEYGDVDGGAQRVRDMVLDALQGELAPVLPDDIQREYHAEMDKRAQEHAAAARPKARKAAKAKRPARRKAAAKPERQKHMTAHTVQMEDLGPDPAEYYESIGATRHRPPKKKARKAVKRSGKSGGSPFKTKGLKPLSARLKLARITREYYPNPKPKFKRGDLVRLRRDYPGGTAYKGDTGIVHAIYKAAFSKVPGYAYEVRFRNAINSGITAREGDLIKVDTKATAINPRQRALGLRARPRPASNKRVVLQFHTNGIWATVKAYPDTPAGERAAITAGKRLHKTLPHKLRVLRTAI